MCRGTRDMAQSEDMNGGWGEAWERAGRARCRSVRRAEGRNIVDIDDVWNGVSSVVYGIILSSAQREFVCGKQSMDRLVICVV